MSPQDSGDPDRRRHGSHHEVSGTVHRDVYQAGGNIDRSRHETHEEPDPWRELSLGRGPGRLLMAVGMLIAFAGFGAWMYFILDAGGLDDPGVNPFDATILGLSAPLVAFGSAAFGAIVSHIGFGMSRAARERERVGRRR